MIEALNTYVRKTAGIIGIQIYGGDFIYEMRENRVYFVDFNDWPTFDLMRNEATEKIISLLLSRR